MSTLRISNIEAKADSSSPTVDEQLRFTNSDGDLMLYLDGRTAGITTVGINTTNQTIKFDANNNVMVTGIVTATEFHGTLAVGTSVTYGDNEKAYFGTGLDLELFHDGTNSFIKNTTGNLRIQDSNGNIQIQAKAGEESIIAKSDGAVELYYNNTKRIETTNTGSTVTGSLLTTGNISINNVAPKIFLTDSDSNSDFSIRNMHGVFGIHDQTNSVDRLVINSSGLVGVGTDNPDAPLTIYTAASQGWKFRIRTSVSDGAGFYQRANGDFELVLRDASNNNNYIAGTGGALQFTTSGSERLRIDSSGRVGINSTAPRTYLQVSKGTCNYNPGNPTALNSANVVACFENSDDVEIALLSNNNKKGIIYFGDTDNTANSSIQYDHNVNHLFFTVNGGSERFRINNSGAFGLNGTNYGTSGQVITSGGTNSPVSWTTIPQTTINNNANDRIITGSGTANTLEAESTVTFDGTQLRVNAGNTSSIQVDGLYSYGSFAGVKIWRGAGNRSHNMAVGNNALANASGGQDCTALGHAALQNSTSGSANTSLGSHSMIGTVTGSNNVAVGHGALNKLTSGYNNTAVGRLSGLELLGGHNNTFLGLEAGTNNTSGSANIYVGSGAGKYETTSADNVVLGYNAFGANRTGGNSNQFNKNTVIGHQALTQQRISNGDGENVCIGYRTMYNTVTAAWRNVVIGFEAGYNNQASKTTFVGTFAGKSYQSGGNTMCLGYNAGTSDSPSGNLTNQQDTIVLGNNGISNLYCADTSISSSDARDKTDITEWTHGLSFINQLKPVTYRWDKRTWYGTDEEPIGTPDGSKKKARLHLGFLAQDALEVEKSFGYASKKDDMLAVNLNEDNTAYGMKYERLVVPLTKAVQELSAEVDKLKAEIAALKST